MVSARWRYASGLKVVVAMLISHKEKLALEKDILWSVCRAVIQLIIVGYVLKYIFG
ncbi:ABC transporter permease, partial [Salmonella enterica subsp. enterica serovar Anatum]|nr:ABC transporter permease [Salmonella enterica subsp. enterica serovar Anatum]